MTRWYRAYEGTVSDAKLGEIALTVECSRSVVIATWHSILEACAAANDGGRHGTNHRRVAAILSEPAAMVEAIFAQFEALGLVTDGIVIAWKRRQFESDNSTDRSKKHRAAKRNGDATLQDRCETPRNGGATPPENIDRDTSSLRSDGGDSPPDQDKDLFRRGREVLGRNAGGQITKLKVAYNGSIAKARAVIENASTKDQPQEWVARAIEKINGRAPATGPPHADEIRDSMTAAAMRLAAELSH